MRKAYPFAGRRAALKLALLALAVTACLCSFSAAAANGDGDEKEKAQAPQPDYTQLVAKTYDYRFGQNPFAPSNATSTTGTFIPGSKFISAARCATCHGDTHAQWRQSAHGNAFREPFYQKNVKDIISQRNIAHTRHCESCHNPAALFSGALTDKPAFKKRPFDEEGVSCIACHSIQDVNRRGIGGYVMGEPALLVKADGTRRLEDVTDQEILDNVDDHRRAMMRPVLKSPEFCGACHKSQVPKELNDYKFLRAFMVADELQMSSFSKESPHPFYVRDKETCNTCHMKPEAAPLFDVAAENGTVKSHRWAAANTALPFFYKFGEQLDAVTKFLEGDVMGIDIFALRRQKPEGGEELIAPLNRSNFKIERGDTLTADVVLTNKNLGHSFPPELRDFYEAHVEFTVADAATGRALFRSGYIKPDGFLDESAHNYKTYLVMPDGTFNDKHFIWKTRVIAQNNQIGSGRSDVARYRFQMPKDLGVEAVKITARLRYRRFTKVFSDYALGKSVDFPIVTMATAEYTLKVGENAAAAPVKGAMPDWRRWNNYGIALFDNRQFPQAADVFARVAELDEAYRAMALTNRALALIEIDRWDDASKLVDAALEINPNLARALFQRARIRRQRGQLAEAEADIRRVLEAFPRDRLSLQQLGELSKIKHDLETARDCYERILKIDPEDTGSHYNLMLIYRKLGMGEQARAEAKIFQDLKDDPGALVVASEFLRRHPEMKGESVPFHVHDLTRGAGEVAGTEER